MAAEAEVLRPEKAQPSQIQRNIDTLKKDLRKITAENAEREQRIVVADQDPVSRTAAGEAGTSELHSIIGRCSAMQDVYKSIGLVAGQDVTVLIRGESGTGKELVARALYQYVERVQGPFLAVHCAAIPEA